MALGRCKRITGKRTKLNVVERGRGGRKNIKCKDLESRS
jgi:hypothetical protein